MDTRSIRHLIIIGLFCIALGFFLIAQATALWQIIAIYATLVPIGVVLAGPLPAQTLVSRWFGKRRGLALGIVTTGTSVGGMTIPLLVSNTVVDFGWRAIHEFIALGIALTLPIIVWFVVRNHPGDMGLQAEPEADLKPGRKALAYPKWTIKGILSERNFWVACGAFFGMNLLMGSVQQHIRPYTADYNISPENTGLIISAMAGTMIVGKIIVGALSDSWDHRLLYWLTVASMMTGVFLMIGVPDFTLVLIAAAFLGFGGGGILPLMGSIFASRFGPMAFGRVLGIAGPFITLSSIGPPLTGFLRDTTGAYDEALLYLLLLTIPSIVIMAFLQPAHKMRTLNGEAAAAKAAE